MNIKILSIISIILGIIMVVLSVGTISGSIYNSSKTKTSLINLLPSILLLISMITNTAVIIINLVQLKKYKLL